MNTSYPDAADPAARATDDKAADAEPPSPRVAPDAPSTLHDGPPPSAERLGELRLQFHAEDLEPHPPATGWIEPHLQRVAELCGVTGGSLEITLVDDATMGPLHEQYCGDPDTTDVLTFDLADPPADEATLQGKGNDSDSAGNRSPITAPPPQVVEGELILCVDEAARQARARGHDTRLELLLYALHGLLHLLGEDDHDETDYQRMHRREDALLRQLGLGSVFDKSESNDGKAAACLADARPEARR